MRQAKTWCCHWFIQLIQRAKCDFFVTTWGTLSKFVSPTSINRVQPPTCRVQYGPIVSNRAQLTARATFCIVCDKAVTSARLTTISRPGPHDVHTIFTRCSHLRLGVPCFATDLELTHSLGPVCKVQSFSGWSVVQMSRRVPLLRCYAILRPLFKVLILISELSQPRPSA